MFVYYYYLYNFSYLKKHGLLFADITSIFIYGWYNSYNNYMDKFAIVYGQI